MLHRVLYCSDPDIILHVFFIHFFLRYFLLWKIRPEKRWRQNPCSWVFFDVIFKPADRIGWLMRKLGESESRKFGRERRIFLEIWDMIRELQGRKDVEHSR